MVRFRAAVWPSCCEMRRTVYGDVRISPHAEQFNEPPYR